MKTEFTCYAKKKNDSSCSECCFFNPLLVCGCEAYGECDVCEFFGKCIDDPCVPHLEDVARWRNETADSEITSLSDAINYPGYPISGEI